MGPEALDLFRRERELGTRNDAVRRALGAPSIADEGPRAVGFGSLLSAEAEGQLWDETLAHEETLGGGGPSAYAALVQDERIWADGLGPDDQAARGGASAYAGLREDERIWEDQLAIEEQGANPREFRSDLVANLREMFAAAGLPFEPSLETWRGFVGDGVNGLTPEDRFLTIGWYGGCSSDQLGLLLDGATVAEVGPPAGQWDGEAGLSPADRGGALAYLQMREPEASDPSGLVPDFVGHVVDASVAAQRESTRRRGEFNRATGEVIQRGLSFASEVVEAALTAEGERIRGKTEAYRNLGESLAEFGRDRVNDVVEIANRVKTLVETLDEETLRMLEMAVHGGCLARERVHQALLGFVTYNPLESDIDETWAARMADGLSGDRTYDGENNRWYEIYPNDPWGRDHVMAEFSEWITDPVTVASIVLPAARALDPIAGGLISQSIEAGCESELG